MVESVEENAFLHQPFQSTTCYTLKSHLRCNMACLYGPPEAHLISHQDAHKEPEWNHVSYSLKSSEGVMYRINYRGLVQGLSRGILGV